jgi:hypothetical protein
MVVKLLDEQQSSALLFVHLLNVGAIDNEYIWIYLLTISQNIGKHGTSNCSSDAVKTGTQPNLSQSNIPEIAHAYSQQNQSIY